jgi:hypothetical protein
MQAKNLMLLSEHITAAAIEYANRPSQRRCGAGKTLRNTIAFAHRRFAKLAHGMMIAAPQIGGAL